MGFGWTVVLSSSEDMVFSHAPNFFNNNKVLTQRTIWRIRWMDEWMHRTKQTDGDACRTQQNYYKTKWNFRKMGQNYYRSKRNWCWTKQQWTSNGMELSSDETWTNIGQSPTKVRWTSDCDVGRTSTMMSTGRRLHWPTTRCMMTWWLATTTTLQRELCSDGGCQRNGHCTIAHSIIFYFTLHLAPKVFEAEASTLKRKKKPLQDASLP
jgi:hypothetical protein